MIPSQSLGHQMTNGILLSCPVGQDQIRMVRKPFQLISKPLTGQSTKHRFFVVRVRKIMGAWSDDIDLTCMSVFSAFVRARLFAFSHRFEQVWHAIAKRGPDTFTFDLDDGYQPGDMLGAESDSRTCGSKRPESRIRQVASGGLRRRIPNGSLEQSGFGTSAIVLDKMKKLNNMTSGEAL